MVSSQTVHQMKKVFVIARGCTKRLLDAKRISTYVSRNGYEIVFSPKEADIIIFIGCAVSTEISRNSLDTVKHLQSYKKELIVGGCLPGISKKELEKIHHGTTFVTRELTENPEKIDELFPDFKHKFSETPYANSIPSFFSDRINFLGELIQMVRNIKPLEKISVFLIENILGKIIFKNSLQYLALPRKKPLFHLRISWGCYGNCAYCGIKNAIGPHISKPIEQCIQEFKRGLSEGYSTFVLESDDTGRYGADIKSSLSHLLKEILRIPGEYKIIIGNISPEWLVRYFKENNNFLENNKKLISIDFSIQSGSSRVLKLMNRYSDVAKIKKALIQLKETSPDIKVYIQGMIGFPTETYRDLLETLNLIKEIDAEGGNLCRFSCISGTEAEKIEPKISFEEKSGRLEDTRKFLKKSGYKVRVRGPESRSIVFRKK